MFGLIHCKRLQLISPCNGNVADSATHLLFLARNALVGTTRSFSSVDDEKKQDGVSKRSFVASYLVNSCGFSPVAAKSLSSRRRIRFNNPERPDSVLNFLKKNGFSHTDITDVVKSYSHVLLSEVDTDLLPKFSFFGSIGFSDDDIVKLFTSNPVIFSCSLNKRLIPWYNFLKTVLDHDEMVTQYLKCTPYILGLDSQKDVVPKFLALKETGMPKSLILSFLRCLPHAFGRRIEEFDEIIKKVVGMGFNPATYHFFTAFEVYLMKKSTLERVVEVYKKWGWSEDEVWSAFKKNPCVLRNSKEQIGSKMDFLVNKTGLQLADIAKCPIIFNTSLEKRIVPRCSVIRVLQLKGLIKQGNLLRSVLASDESFLSNFVTKYQDQVPELLDIYHGKRRIRFDSPERPDPVLDFLKNNGFSIADITKVVRSYPHILLSKVDINLLPKFSFFRSIGFSDDDIVKLFTLNPVIFSSSLNERLKPWYIFLKSVLGQDEMVTQYLKCSPYILRLDSENDVAPKFLALREIGVPQFSVLRLLRYQPRAFGLSTENFDEIVKKIVDMGFNPATDKFVTAFEVFQMEKSTLDCTVEDYKKWGWSEDEVWSAFKKNPRVLRISKEGIRSVMDFLLNKMGWQLADIARYPTILNFSLQKKIVPWCSVIRVLQLKGLVKQQNPPCSVLCYSQDFLSKFVMKYRDQVPELLDIYHGKTTLKHLGLRFEQKSMLGKL